MVVCVFCGGVFDERLFSRCPYCMREYNREIRGSDEGAKSIEISGESKPIVDYIVENEDDGYNN